MTVWPDPPPDGTGLKSWREESNLRSPGYQPGVLTAVLRQGMTATINSFAVAPSRTLKARRVSITLSFILQQKKNRLPLLTDGHENTKDLTAMMESWCPHTYIPFISFGQHKQTNLPSANSSLDLLMLALNGSICVHEFTVSFLQILTIWYQVPV